jgi:hypothetical protein
VRSVLFNNPVNSSDYIASKVKGKVDTRTGHEDSEGEQTYTSTLSLTLSLDGGGERPGKIPSIVGDFSLTSRCTCDIRKMCVICLRQTQLCFVGMLSIY